VRAIIFDTFSGPLDVVEVDDPVLPADGVIVNVAATGVCKSDWYGWQGTDPAVRLPHVPGHELAGMISAVGPDVREWSIGDRVTVPFACGCGVCPQCDDGRQNLCEQRLQVGFSHWGAFAERIALHHADVNLVELPGEVSWVAGAALGCRFATAYRAVIGRGAVRPGRPVAVFGCGGVGLSAIMVAAAVGADVVAIDVNGAALQLARDVGATRVVDALSVDDVAAAVRDLTDGGVDVSIDAVGDAGAVEAGLRSLRRGGRHVQVGMIPPSRYPPLLADLLVRGELELVGSFGMAAHDYPPMLELIVEGRLRPEALVTNVVGLDDAPAELAAMGDGVRTGVTVVAMPAGGGPG
jgi:alcohol dehydrogenase